ncbi:MAG: M23 family metallopeptidase [Chloroflexi bacterium]|nr:M23 family metallopeptidase [Chloroflexota bacterium]
MSRVYRVALTWGVMFLLLLGGRTMVQAQGTCPVPTTYVVQPGDALSLIAERFGTDVTTLMRLNGLSDPNHIQVGQRLQVPCPITWGMEVEARVVGGWVLGLGLPPAQGDGWIRFWHARAHAYRAWQQAPFTLSLLPPTARPGDTPVLILQPHGREPITGCVHIFDLCAPLISRGEEYASFVPLHGFVEPGILTVTVDIRAGSTPTQTYTLPLWVRPRTFEVQYIDLPQGKGELLDPQLVQAEAQQLAHIWAQSAEKPLWEGPFQWPIDPNTYPTTAPYGGRRSYNGGPVQSYHTGQDFGAPEGTPVFAPAAGRVVLAEPLHVRGNVVVIDHGAGVMSNYWHLSELHVRAGERVRAGTLIGKVGTTGLSTGAHLHWEIRVYGIPVDPIPWTRAPGPATWWR